MPPIASTVKYNVLLRVSHLLASAHHTNLIFCCYSPLQNVKHWPHCFFYASWTLPVSLLPLHLYKSFSLPGLSALHSGRLSSSLLRWPLLTSFLFTSNLNCMPLLRETISYSQLGVIFMIFHCINENIMAFNNPFIPSRNVYWGPNMCQAWSQPPTL